LNGKHVSTWLFILSFMVCGMIAGGGHARTIGAAFVMQDWSPITGILPPSSAAAWQHAFGLYQATASYSAHPITMPQFKALYWPMFLDRDWGRLMALTTIIPLAWFWVRRQISTRLALWIVAIFAAGAAQAVFGWIIVRAGLHQPDLPAALAAPHFVSGIAIFAALLWTALTVRTPVPTPSAAGFLRPWADASLAFVFVTASFGALVATSGALAFYHSFPLMDGQLVPSNLFADTPLWSNFLANPATIQFFHRTLATVTALTVLTTTVIGLRSETTSDALRDTLLAAAALTALQYLLGMATIVLGSVDLGYIHELNAVALLGVLLIARHQLRGAATRRTLPALS
jgi:cytochrome c oxidase assembly protein subunit 15